MNGKTKRDQNEVLVINGGQYLMICPKSSMHWKPPVFSSVNHVYFKNCFYCDTSNLKK
jgi:hypothetical protein